MRIVSVSPGSVALVLSLVYGVFGIGDFLFFAFTNAQDLTLPIGFVAPLLYLSFNLHLPRTTSIGFNLLYVVAALLAWALTGAITGEVGTLCFNLIAKQLGGIPAKFIETIDEEKLK